MNNIRYIDRKTGVEQVEKVYGGKTLGLLYGDGWLSLLLSWTLLPLLAHFPFCSKIYGFFQKTARSRKKIAPFIEAYGIDSSEFEQEVSSFGSFNDFFIRKLNPRRRPIDPGTKTGVMPADGRYLVYPDLSQVDGFYVKGQKFSLTQFLGNPILGRRFAMGSMAIIRLCPTDYHRFHFPCGGVACKPKRIQGSLFSVNPIALRKNLSILWKNKRYLTEIDSPSFGTVLYVEVGATSVGTVRQTFDPARAIAKGQEKGYFEFGGSCVVLLFEPGRTRFDADLIANSARHIETLGHLGESLCTTLS